MSMVVDINRVSDMAAQDANRRKSSSTIPQDDNIYERLKKAAQDGDIERLYKLIAEEPNILGNFDKMHFCETPLHIAAEEGQTQFAMELMNLKPSLASKLNVSGFSPMHLALQNKHFRMVRGFVAIDSSLISIKGRGMITPLHHVARVGETELLSEFLFACPSSLNDLTVKCETAVHVAVKNGQLKAFKVLLGWIKRVNKEAILDLKDEDGNTALHNAASINQTEVMKLLGKVVKVKAKNLDGKTAKDILQIHQSPCFPEARNFLHSVKEKILCRSTTNLGNYLTQKLSLIERRNKFLGLSNLSMTGDMSLQTSNRHDAILVVAILIVTATYQAGLSPPGGFWQETTDDHDAGQMTMKFFNAVHFIFLNGIAFLLSLFVIIFLIVGLPMWKLVYGSTAALSVGMLASYTTIFPDPSYTEIEKHPFRSISTAIFLLVSPVIIVILMFATYIAFIADKRRRHRVDFPAACFSLRDASSHPYLSLLAGICVIVGVYVSWFKVIFEKDLKI
ncbi:unnamed protein product [Thlaspi arvense]|uniref:PGG domain-containing protein n=1 Tax=Thlaspi arvense TaxID=13288 RepID=A0AAU9SQT8_THLAR|nr:unnamed protein product [Thlaspi arvense]